MLTYIVPQKHKDRVKIWPDLEDLVQGDVKLVLNMSIEEFYKYYFLSEKNILVPPYVHLWNYRQIPLCLRFQPESKNKSEFSMGGFSICLFSVQMFGYYYVWLC